MPLRLNCGVSKKVGQPDFGSLGACCNVDIELDGSLLSSDPEAFHRRVRQVFSECRRAVNDELAQHGEPADDLQCASAVSTPVGNGRNGNAANGHHASQKQLDYIDQLARQVRGLGVRRLDALANKMFDKPIASLSSLEASGVIDCIKAIKDGSVNLEDALNGAAI